MSWQTRREERDAVTRAFLERDRDWAAYLLADLDPPYRQHARFYLAAADGADRALVLVYAPPEFAAISSMGEPAGIAAALDQIPDLPEQTFLVIPESHQEVFEAHYRPALWWRMRRMRLRSGELRLPSGVEQAEPLGVDDRIEIERLLTGRGHQAAFTASMLASGVYYGIRASGRLAAVAGTHAVSTASRLACIGNVFTAPEMRGRGYAAAVTAAVARVLFERDCDRLLLNVNTENQSAIRVYERLGFTTHTECWEGPDARRRK
jgi:ribosomal protein S18 acetylase RimI-like enzyme